MSIGQRINPDEIWNPGTNQDCNNGFVHEYQNTKNTAFILITEEAHDNVTAPKMDFETICEETRDGDVIEPGPVVIGNVIAVRCSQCIPWLGQSTNADHLTRGDWDQGRRKHSLGMFSNLKYVAVPFNFMQHSLGFNGLLGTALMHSNCLNL